MKLKSLAKGLLVAAALALTLVAAPVSSIKAEAAEGTYTVEKDDYLRKIAKKVYGDEELWKIIYDANSNVIKSNYIIYKGQVLTIPSINNYSVTTPAAPDPVPTTPAPTTQVPAQESEFILDYEQIASWLYGGFVGSSTTGETVIMGLDSEYNYGIIIFQDESDKTAVSFIGPVEYGGDYMRISDEVNGLALTFSVTEGDDGVLVLDMGELGVATVAVQTKERTLQFIKMSIDGYTHVA